MKIIKDHDNYHLVDSEQFVIGTTDKSNTKYKLSHKNCQAIFNGYDLDEMACVWHKNEYGFIPQLQVIKAYIAGFQKALEILGDKKFSEADVREAIDIAWFDDNIDKSTIIQSLQQTEIEVEIVMIKKPDGIFRENDVPYASPKLDADGCLILKRK